MLQTDSKHTSPISASRLDELVAEMSARVEAGELVDLVALTADYPELREQLEMLLPTLQAIADWKPDSLSPVVYGSPDSVVRGSPDPAHPASNLEHLTSSIEPPGGYPASSTATLGDFRILREIGRGGMGVVYEAEQLSLGRRVALKVLPFAAMLDRQQLARFKNEARAAATLDHPHIVAIHSVGCERGVHYYAMQLIEGHSLAEVIEQTRIDVGCSMLDVGSDKESNIQDPISNIQHPTSSTTPVRRPSDSAAAPPAAAKAQPPAGDTVRAALSTLRTSDSAAFFRTVAQLGIQAAEALDHAHQNGILHRDIKPANLLVDDTGKLWITDFGLARMEQDAGMTMTGDILGTLRYMSPEQALAKRVVVDHRSDIYSLGVTLYELLTLHPAFTGEDRQELLRQIAFDEPRPPRKINSQIPVDVETVVLKAMAKHREERYQTAQHMADDLRSFVENKPIKARTPTLANRAAKWSRRHQNLVTSVAIGFVILSAVLTVSMMRVQTAKTQALAALAETADLLYTTDMTLAYQAFEKGWSDEVHAILDRYRPTESGVDRRGFEWYLLKTLVQPPASFALSGHKGPVNEMAVFPDRERLASVGQDGAVRIWNVRTHKLLRTINLGNEPLHSVAVSPDGRYIAAGNTVVYLCDLEGSAPPRQVFQSEHTVESLAFTPDAQALAAGVRYHELCLISLEGKILQRIPCASRVESLEFVRDTQLLLVPNRRPSAASRQIGFVQIWDDILTDVKAELNAPGVDGQITVARSSPCGRFIAAGERYRARMLLFERTSGRVIAGTPVSRARLTDLDYSLDGKALAAGYENGCLEHFPMQLDDHPNPSIKRRPLVVDAHLGEVNCVRFIEAGSLATCGTDGLIRIWDLTANASYPLDLTDNTLTGLQLSPDGELLLSTSHQEIIIFNLERGEVIFRTVGSEFRYSTPIWSPAGDKAIVRELNGGSVVILNRNGRTIGSIAHEAPLAAAFSPDGSLIAIISANQLQICRANSAQVVFRQPMSSPNSVVGFSRDGARLAYGGGAGLITILELREMRLLRELSCGSGVHCLAFSPDDSIIASGHRDSIIRLWDAQTGILKATLAGHEQDLNSLLFSPDGHTLLSSADDGIVRIWSVDRGRGYGVVSQRFDLESPSILCQLSLSGDGSRLAIGYALQ